MINTRSCRLIAVIAGFILTASSAVTEITDTSIIGGPIIMPNNSEIILENGANFTLRCKGNRKLQFKQQDIYDSFTDPFTINQKIISTSDDAYGYEIALELIQVNEFAVGYYACFDDTVSSMDILQLDDLTEELINTEHISYIYIYVNGSESLFASMNEMVTANDDSNIVIGCKPTSPDIEVKLISSQNNKAKQENVTFSPKIGFLLKVLPRKSVYTCEGRRGNETSRKSVYKANPPPEPMITASEYFLKGETFSMNCTVPYQKNSPISLEWRIPHSDKNVWSTIYNETNEYNVINGILYYNITIFNATENDAGRYSCISRKIYEKQKYFDKKILEKPFVILEPRVGKFHEVQQDFIPLPVKVSSYPKAKMTYMKNFHEKIVIDGKKYKVKSRPYMNITEFTILNLSVYDTANYTIIASNIYDITLNVTFDVRVMSKPELYFETLEDQKHFINSKKDSWVQCNATGYRPPNITWSFKPFNGVIETTLPSYTNVQSLTQVSSSLNLSYLQTSGTITCTASNNKGQNSLTKNVYLLEIDNGFGIKNKNNNWFVKNQNVTLTCIASKYDYTNVTWDHEEMNSDVTVKYSQNDLSYIAELKIVSIFPTHGHEYTCIGYKEYDEINNDSITITVEDLKLPEFIEPSIDRELDMYPFQSVTLNCSAFGVPRPSIQWYKDGILLEAVDNETSIETLTNNTNTESRLYIRTLQEELGGKYYCLAENKGGQLQWSKYLNVIVNAKSASIAIYLSIIVVIVIILVILIIYLAFKIKKEKRFKRELAKAGLLYFKEGVTKSLNPELGIDEQAELLPYDDRFEFPVEKLVLGKQLGSGAFGVVYKAEARGIMNAEETTTVAVKMVKKNANNLSVKSLASELKIMVHMGRHINIVNLLGACTKNVGKRELSVIVEYCKYGNIHNYMIKHREVFIDQLITSNNEKNAGRVNRGFSCSSGNSGTHSDYFGFNHTQDTDNTFINTSNSNRSATRNDNGIQQVELGKVSESGYIQPMWRSNYESDYSYDGHTPRPLYSRDLLCWSFQIARGMEYLARKKVLHGDLAARNILLADDNIVKICDFGLARSIYKTDEYQKTENSPLPVKWLAIECMTDRIFSTQSDVWSFGIVLWELFTLAKTPYPNMSPADLLPWLLAGKRLDKPRYADDRIYTVMLQCWEKKPTLRPSFTTLQETLGTFLEDNVRNHYVDLNSAYMDLNSMTRPDGQEDYLAIMRAPDYNNHVTPSPHQYVNDIRSFFPPTPNLPQDDDGYLQMSPVNQQCNPHIQIDTFDFEARKMNSRPQEGTPHVSELTPMLTLNNLPTRSGSESDQEGNSSPYLNMCPRIDEEADEVFETKQNNTKNVAQNRAVTNPTYIAFDTDLEKKNENHSYLNISNGLVK